MKTTNVKNMRSLRRNQGMALVTVLLIIALGTTLISLGALKSSVAVSRVENTRLLNQLYQYALSAEHWAVLMLYSDTNGYDSYQEKWGQISSNSKLDDAIITTRIDDEQSKLNINYLATGFFWRKRFIDFLKSLEVDDPESMFNAITDYIDNDQLRFAHGGAEERLYLDDDLPYRPLDRQLVLVEEVLAAKGINAEDVAKVRPYLTAFPIEFSFLGNDDASEDGFNAITGSIETHGLPINILTCELPLFNLFSSTGYSTSTLAVIQDIRSNYTDDISKIKQDVLRQLTHGGSKLRPEVLESVIDGKSQVFSVHTTVELGGMSMTMYSLLYRPSYFRGSRVSVINRWSELN